MSASIRKICFFGGYSPGYPRNDVLKKGLEKRGVEVVECHVSPKRRAFSRYLVLTVRYLRIARDFEVIYVPEFRHKDVPLAFVLARLTGKKVVFDPLVSRYDTKIKDRGDARDGGFQSWHNRNLDRLSLSLCDLVLADTVCHADYYASEFGIDRERVRVLPVGFDEDVFQSNGTRNKNSSSPRPMRVVFVGNYLPLHGADIIVEAARELRSESRIEFVLIGDGQTRPIVEALVKQLCLSNVTLRPRIPLKEMATELADADVSLGTFGRTDKTKRVIANKIYQSMAVGTAVVTADTPAIRERFVDAENVSLVPPANPLALAKKILELFENPAMRAAQGEAAARLVHEKYGSLAIAGRFLHILQVLL